MRDRAQLVLAAAVVAVALAPAVLAYLQLGYAADVNASDGYDAPSGCSNVRSTRRVQASRRTTPGGSVAAPSGPSGATSVRGSSRWSGACDRRDRGPGPVHGTAAREWAAANCPGGDGRQFGPCRADRGVVVQRRAGETHPVAVAFDLRVTSERGRTDLTVVVRSVGRRA